MTAFAATKSEIKSSIQGAVEIALVSSQKLIIDQGTTAVEERPVKRLGDITDKVVQVSVKNNITWFTSLLEKN